MGTDYDNQFTLPILQSNKQEKYIPAFFF